MTEPYNDVLRSLFFDLRHAGDPQTSYDNIVSGRAGSVAGGAEVQLLAGVSDGRLRELSFRVYGGPHLTAACEYLCRQANEVGADALSEYSRDELMETLAVPIERTGRILLLEDALESLVAQMART